MLKVFYEDQDVIVVKKPVGTESQAVHSFAPDMVSEIKKHIHRLSTENGEKTGGRLCGSYPQAGQACGRDHGVCQE